MATSSTRALRARCSAGGHAAPAHGRRRASGRESVPSAAESASGTTDSSVTPRPNNSGTASGSEASPPQTATGQPCTAAPCVVASNEAQHRRMHAVDARRQFGMTAVHGQCVLRQVVGADGNEVDRLCDLVGQHGRGRRFDHRAEQRFLHIELARQLDQARPHRGNFGHIRDHGQQDAHCRAAPPARRATACRATRAATGWYECRAIPAPGCLPAAAVDRQSACRRRCRGCGSPADAHRAGPRPAGSWRAVRLRRERCCGRGTGTRCAAGRSPRHPAPSQARDPPPCRRDWRTPRCVRRWRVGTPGPRRPVSRALAFAAGGETRARGVELRRGRCAVHSARLGVENDHGAVRQRLQLRSHTHHHGHTQGGGEDGHMRGRASGHASAMPPSRVLSMSISCEGVRSRATRIAAGRDVEAAAVRRRRARAAPGARDRPGPRHARRGAHRRWPPAPRRSCADCARHANAALRPARMSRAREREQLGVVEQFQVRGHDVAHSLLRALRALLDARAHRGAARGPTRRFPGRHRTPFR